MARGLLPVLPAALALAVALAACTQPGPEAAPGAAPPAHLSLTGCSGWYAGMGPLPPAVAPGSAPAGWEPAPHTVATIQMAGFACERLGLGPFERGPVHLAFDAHTRAVIPEACLGSDRQVRAGIVGTVWADDGEVARYLAEAYGLPARFATFAVGPQAQAQAAAGTGTWAWTDSGETSEITVPSSEAAYEDAGPSVFLWEAGGRITALSLVASGRESGAVELPAVGAMRAPALASTLPGGAFAGSAVWASGFSAEGTFTTYRDRMCAQPEPEVPA